MRIPKQFRLKGKLWKVVYKADLTEEGEELDGLCVFKSRTIYLEASLKGRKKVSVFLHELSHAMIHEAHIAPGVRFSEGVEEVICDAFADLMTTAFTLEWKKQR